MGFKLFDVSKKRSLDRHALYELAEIVMHNGACHVKFSDVNHRINRSRNQYVYLLSRHQDLSAIIAHWYAVMPVVDPQVDQRRINTHNEEERMDTHNDVMIWKFFRITALLWRKSTA